MSQGKGHQGHQRHGNKTRVCVYILFAGELPLIKSLVTFTLPSCVWVSYILSKGRFAPLHAIYQLHPCIGRVISNLVDVECQNSDAHDSNRPIPMPSRTYRSNIVLSSVITLYLLWHNHGWLLHFRILSCRDCAFFQVYKNLKLIYLTFGYVRVAH